jgi:hypothetical protein
MTPIQKGFFMVIIYALYIQYLMEHLELNDDLAHLEEELDNEIEDLEDLMNDLVVMRVLSIE